MCCQRCQHGNRGLCFALCAFGKRSQPVAAAWVIIATIAAAWAAWDAHKPPRAQKNLPWGNNWGYKFNSVSPARHGACQRPCFQSYGPVYALLKQTSLEKSQPAKTFVPTMPSRALLGSEKPDLGRAPATMSYFLK